MNSVCSCCASFRMLSFCNAHEVTSPQTISFVLPGILRLFVLPGILRLFVLPGILRLFPSSCQASSECFLCPARHPQNASFVLPGITDGLSLLRNKRRYCEMKGSLQFLQDRTGHRVSDLSQSRQNRSQSQATPPQPVKTEQVTDASHLT